MDESEEAVVVVGTLEEAEAVVGTSRGVGGRGGEDNLPGKERPGGRGNQKRKRSDDTSLPPKRIKKCRALHGLEQKELWCQPCINSKEMC